MTVIEAQEITKTYPAQGGKRALLGRGGIARLFRNTPTPPRQALAPLSLTVEPGEALGIIGRNGSGKSTLLKIIAGVSAATTGTLRVHGRVASLLELGAGFHPMLTGRENIYLNAGLLGMRHAQVDACFDAIVEFAELEAYIDHTVDTYSSGMYVRLAFSVAIHTDPDVFLVDEVLAVGDESFQRKCRARILELKAAGKTILFVSHDLGTVQALCDRVLLLDQGAVISQGNTQNTIDYYLRQIGQASGIRRLIHGDTEVLFNHGRLSLFHRQQELTAPLGIKAQFFSMEAYHESTEANWEICAATDERLEATGTFPRLPLRLYIVCEVGTAGLTVEISWENTQPLDLSYAAIQCFTKTSYTRWHGGAASGTFPTITADDHRWSVVAQPRQNVWACELTGDESSDMPPLCFAVDEAHSQARFQINNTDYMAQARLVHLTEAIPSGNNPLPPKRRHLGSLRIDPSQTAEQLAETKAQRSIARQLKTDRFVARLHDGFIEITLHEQAPTTSFPRTWESRTRQELAETTLDPRSRGDDEPISPSGSEQKLVVTETKEYPLTHFMPFHFQLRVGYLWIMR
ncbi:MAG: ABC transporter ATP-binding protein, partial [Candidatus Hydrogenedentes bacterium]|nr:ABC transporter ATP-binding protein [Candidatus Hydrogenedentota bacterium]